MKIGELDIKKAYFGVKELTPNNAYLGDVPIKKDEGIPNDEIWYTSSNNDIVEPYDISAFPTILSNVYADSKGIIKFETNIEKIANYAFYECEKLISITIPNSVTSIDENAFSECTGLTSVSIPNSVISIGLEAFYDCSGLTSVTIPNSVTSIGSSAFQDCTNLTSISYTGTITQWNAITKGYNWNNNILATVVHCTDGDVAI